MIDAKKIPTIENEDVLIVRIVTTWSEMLFIDIVIDFMKCKRYNI